MTGNQKQQNNPLTKSRFTGQRMRESARIGGISWSNLSNFNLLDDLSGQNVQSVLCRVFLTGAATLWSRTWSSSGRVRLTDFTIASSSPSRRTESLGWESFNRMRRTAGCTSDCLHEKYCRKLNMTLLNLKYDLITDKKITVFTAHLLVSTEGNHLMWIENVLLCRIYQQARHRVVFEPVVKKYFSLW